MKTFEKFPKECKCPICDTNKQEEGVLLAIYGSEEGYNVEAMPVHLSCIDLWIIKDKRLIMQKY